MSESTVADARLLGWVMAQRAGADPEVIVADHVIMLRKEADPYRFAVELPVR